MKRALGLAGAALLLLNACQPSSSTPVAQTSPSPSGIASPTPVTGPLLVFQHAQGATTFVTLATADGTAIKSITLDGRWAADWQGATPAVFVQEPEVSASALMGRDGVLTPIPPALAGYFGADSLTAMAPPVLLDGRFVTGVVGGDPSTIVAADLATGTATTLLSARRLAAVSGAAVAPPILIDLGSRPGSTVALVVVRHADFGQKVAQWMLVRIDIRQRAIVGMENLPIAAGVDAYDAFAPAVSDDGSLFAYEEDGTSAGPLAAFRIHVVDLTSHRDVIAADKNLRVDDGWQPPIAFSPDGSAMSAFGEDAHPASAVIASRLDVVSTRDGTVLASVAAGDRSLHKMRVIGWLDDQTLLYDVSNTDVPGNFDNATHAVYALNVRTQSATAYPAALGQLVAILTP